MMTCAGFDVALVDYLAGGLGEAEAFAIEDHAGGCERCAALLEEASRLPVAFSPEVQPPADLRRMTLDAVAHRRGRGRAVRWLVPPAIAALVVLGFGLSMPKSKAARMREYESRSPHALAQSRAFPEFERLGSARSELERLRERAGADERARLDRRLRLVERQYNRLVTMVEEFEE